MLVGNHFHSRGLALKNSDAEPMRCVIIAENLLEIGRKRWEGPIINSLLASNVCENLSSVGIEITGAGGANVKVRGNYLAGMEEPDPADTSIHQMQTGVFFNTSGTTSGADVSGNTFDYITQDAIRFHRAILECNVSHNICKGYNSSASASFAAINIINTSGLGNAIARSVIQGNTGPVPPRSEEHTSELQSIMRNSYAVICLKKKRHTKQSKYE